MEVGPKELPPEEFWAPIGSAIGKTILEYGWQSVLLIVIAICLIFIAKYGFAYRTEIKKLEHDVRNTANMDRALAIIDKVIDAKIASAKPKRLAKRRRRKP